MYSTGTVQGLSGAIGTDCDPSLLINELSEKTLPASYAAGLDAARISSPGQAHPNRTLSAGSKLKPDHQQLNDESNENLMKIATLKETYNQYVKYQSQLARHAATPNGMPGTIKQARKSALVVSRDVVSSNVSMEQPKATASYVTLQGRKAVPAFG